MSDFLRRIANLSPEKKRQLLRKIEEEGGAANAFLLSFSQERLWFLDQLAPGVALYNLPIVLRFAGALDLAALAHSRDEIVRRHESLRSAFPEVGGRPIQVVLPFAPQLLPLVDLSALPVARRETEARHLAYAEALQPFDLARGPLLRILLLRLELQDHVLAATMHHIVSDAWSLGIFLEELSALYTAFCSGRPSPLPPLRVQLRDFVLWQRRSLQDGGLEAEIDHWRRRLAGMPAELDLPADRPRPPVQSFRGSSRSFQIPDGLAAALHQLASKRGATLFMTLLAVFETLLLRYTGRKDLVIGTAVAQRDRPELERLIGFLVNTLVLRTDLSGDPSFEECLDRVRETVLEAHAHQSLAFEKLVEALQPERSLSRSPLFQVAFDLQNLPPPGPALPGLRPRAFAAESRTAKFDLRLSMTASAIGLNGTFEYAAELFDPTRIARMGTHLCNLAGSIVADPGRRLSTLDLLTEGERHQLLCEWNDTAGVALGPGGAYERFAQQAERTPDRLALVLGEEQVTYRELARRACRLAGLLKRHGTGPETLVGICLERSTDMVAALLGVLAAGGAYLPLDPKNPPDRLGFFMEDSRLPLLLTRRSLDERLPPSGAERLWLETGWETGDGTADGFVPPCVPEDSLAYVIYTSGSTGRPKGVRLTHRGLCNLVDGFIPAGERVLQFSFFNFDASVVEIFMTLLQGATLVLARQDDLLPGPSLTTLLREQKVDTLIIPPSALAAMPEQPLPDLRTLIVAGEVCGAELVERQGRGRRFFNAYGPTEATVCATFRLCAHDGGRPDIGRPIRNVRAHILDADLQPVPIGAPGELHIGGTSVGRGYLDRPAETASRFIPDPFSEQPGSRLYKTGDLARHLPGGEVDFLGRIDHQIKLRGFRIELGEIEEVIRLLPDVGEAAVAALPGPGGERRLVAYVVPRQIAAGGKAEAGLRAHLEERLPKYMVPSAFVWMDELPRNSSGKLDRSALPAPGLGRRDDAGPLLPRTGTERAVASIWQEVLGLERVAVHDNFFDLGGHSLLLAQVHSRLRALFDADLALIDLFAHPTINALAGRLDELMGARDPIENPEPEATVATEDPRVAVIGFALRAPGAVTPEELWRNLCAGVESIQFPADDELLALGVSPARLRDPRYVKARSCLEGIDGFDAGFFRMSPAQAALMDPQQRFFLECAWEALENAGYGAGARGRPVGVYAGKGSNHYLFNLFSNPEVLESMGLYQVRLVNENDHLATRVSYLLDLEGPSVTVQTACSTSLVAVHLACQSLLGGECGMALAGGVTINTLPQTGYVYQEGGINSPDGHCRPFDAEAAGTIGASGAGVVVLKRLRDALTDGDTIHAVIRGSAINNDGAAKVGYTAPRIEGQARVIREAQRRAGVRAEDITYVEAHGTATELGDPIEVAALTQAFRATTARKGFCALGSVKSNFGHCDTAAGVVGLIKTVLCLEHEALPPNLHFRRPNPKIDLEASPFYVNAQLAAWKKGETPRRAGVSSFGIGGTNAHVVLEEAPEAEASSSSRSWQMLTLSARTGSALETATASLCEHLRRQPKVPLADVAYTLQTGRTVFSHRRVVLCRDAQEAADALGSRDAERVFSRENELQDQPFVFLFPGQGSQHVDMGRELYESEPVFRREVDRACEILHPALGLDLREVLYPRKMSAEEATRRLDSTALAQPALFVIEHSLARLWMSWLGAPAAMIGHSLGEYVAACLAGVLTLEQALALVAARGRLMEETRPGAMLAVPLDEEEVLALAGGEISLAAVNGPSRCVVSGPEEAVETLQDLLAGKGLEGRRLPTSRAFHSSLMDPILEPFASEARKSGLMPPRLPYISNVTGTWITAEQATDPDYWCRHLRRTVRFEEGLRELWRSSEGVLLEAGPGATLTALANRHPGRPAEREALSSLGHSREAGSDLRPLLTTLGRLWLAGVTVSWPAFYAGESRRRVSLPTYPFERQRHWIDARPAQAPAARGASGRFQAPAWVRSPEIPDAPAKPAGPWLLFLDSCGLGEELARRLEARGVEVIAVAPGASENPVPLVRQLCAEGRLPAVVAHLGSVTAEPLPAGARNPAFDGVLSLARTFETESPGVSQTIAVVSNHLHAVTGDEALCPVKAGVLALCESPELTGTRCRNIDVTLPRSGACSPLLRLLETELAGPGTEQAIALRGRFRWEQTREPIRLDRQDGLSRQDGTWLVTGGPAARPLVEELAQCLDPRLRVALTGDVAALRAEKVDGGVLCVDPEAADLEALASFLNELDGSGPEVLAISSTLPAGIEERRVVATLATLAAQPESHLRLLRWNRRPSASAIVETLEKALASEVTEILVTSGPDETLPAVTPPARDESRPQGQSNGNAVEARIAKIWRDLLGTPLGLHDNFFEKGADSLSMLSLTAQIRDIWQVDLPLRLVLEAPTVAQLALKVGEELARHASEARTRETSHTLVEIQAGRPEKVPFFTVHAAGGNVLRYRNLARHLGSDRPVYALQAPGIEQGDEKIFTRLEDLAAHHIAAVRTLRPRGPYLLGGWSAGGTIAFEMAQQLRRMGEEVLLVVLMDTYAPQAGEGFDERQMLLWQAWRFNLAIAPEDLEDLPDFDAKLDRIVDLAFARGAIPPQFGRDQARRLLAVEIANMQAILDYRAEPYPGRLSYFRCVEGTDFSEFALKLFPRVNELDHAAAWTGLTLQPMPVFDIPGDHNSVLTDERAVGILARHLRKCFAGVERGLREELPLEEWA